MGTYLAIYQGAADNAELDEQQQADFADAWAAWAQRHQGALVDPGAPGYRGMRFTGDGVQNFMDASSGYAIVRADSHEEAVRIFSEHPHRRFFPGNSMVVRDNPSAAH